MLSVIVLSVRCAECQACLMSRMLSVVNEHFMLSVVNEHFMLSVIMLGVVMLKVTLSMTTLRGT